MESSGRTLSAVVEGLNGRAELSGTDLVLHGLDLDEQLDRYESTQQFNLVDTAALLLAEEFDDLPVYTGRVAPP